MSIVADTAGAGSTTHGSPREEVTLREVQVNLLECKVCFEKFSSQQSERRPQNLSCGHVLCLECVRALSHPLLRKLECPFCRQLCDVDATSPCRALIDLQELLLSKYYPRSPVPHRAKAVGALSPAAGSGWAEGLGSRALRLCSAFGGWGTLINPTGIAMFGSSGTIVVVHDGEHRLVVFGPQGRKMHSFGRKGRGVGEIWYPLDVAVTSSGYVVVTDAGDSAVKVFTSRGSHVLTVKDPFQLPWGVDTDLCGHILVSDTQAGSLWQVTVDYTHGETLMSKAVLTELQHPRAVACCQVTGHVVVVEHLDGATHPPGQHLQPTRLTVFDKDFRPLCQTDSFSLSLRSKVWLCVSAVAFDREGDVIVIDSQQGMVWSLGKIPSGLVLVPLVRETLVHPVGLVAFATAPGGTLTILDGGDHAVKTYA